MIQSGLVVLWTGVKRPFKIACFSVKYIVLSKVGRYSANADYSYIRGSKVKPSISLKSFFSRKKWVLKISDEVKS